jgi:hypothetical protein
MNDKDALPGSGVPQDEPFLSEDAVFLDPVAPASPDIVVAHDEVKAILLVEPVQEVKDTSVSIPNVAKLSVLPKLVAISDFNIGEPFLVVVMQCMQEYFFISGKGICPAVVPPVTIAKKDDPASIVKENFSGRLKHLGQPTMGQGAPDILSGSRILQCP